MAGRKLVKVNAEKGSFEANNRTYYIESSLSAQRWKEKNKLEIELGYGTSFLELFNQIRGAFEDINRNRPADCSVKLYNIMDGLTSLEKRDDPTLKYCTLFINEENEDRRFWNDDLARKKIEDWEEEGIDIAFFLTVSFNAISGLKELYLKTSQSISNQEEQEKND